MFKRLSRENGWYSTKIVMLKLNATRPTTTFDWLRWMNAEMDFAGERSKFHEMLLMARLIFSKPFSKKRVERLNAKHAQIERCFPVAFPCCNALERDHCCLHCDLGCLIRQGRLEAQRASFFKLRTNMDQPTSFSPQNPFFDLQNTMVLRK